jgi:MULE transposase domain/SWIM zinc finger
MEPIAKSPDGNTMELELIPEATKSPTLWCVPIPFEVQSVSDGPFVQTNLCDVMRIDRKNQIYRFDPTVFAPTTAGKTELMRQLQMEAKKASNLSLITSSGKIYTDKSGATYSFALVCACSRVYEGSGEKREDGTARYKSKVDTTTGTVISQDVKAVALHGNRKNNREGGQNASKRTSTGRRLTANDPKCTFRLPVYVDSQSYLMKGSVGNADHCNHMEPIALSATPRVATRLIPDADKQFAQAIVKAHAGTAVNVNVMNAVNPEYRISRANFRSLCPSGAKATGTHADDYDATAEIKRELIRHKAQCQFLMHEANPSEASTSTSGSMVTEFLDGTETVVQIPSMIDDEESEANHYVNSSRQSLQLRADQRVMVAYAWVLPFEKQQFALFPNVLHFDGTSDTNNEKRILFTVSGRDSCGHQFIVLRALIPNECAWMFRWLFCGALPKLLGRENLNRVLLVLTDGDSQETSQMDIAIRKYMPSAVRGRCIWHIVDRGMMKHYPSPSMFANKKAHGTVKATIRQWLWSWSQSACETEEEYALSKALLLAYLSSSSEVKNAFAHSVKEVSDAAIASIHAFVVKNVETHDDYFLFYLRKSMLTFETNSNSAHEGTNNGLKYNASSASPQNSLATCTEKLCFQASEKANNVCSELQYHNEQKELYTDLPTANTLTRFGNGLLLEQWKQREHYKICGPVDNTWQCMRIANATDHLSALVPRFTRVRKVSLREARLYCTCEWFERVGIPCRHVLCVLSTVHGEGYNGVSKTDVKVCWWKEYYFGGVFRPKSSNHSNLVERSKNDVKGPYLKHASFPFIADEDDAIWTESQKPLMQRCRNYSQADCEKALRLFSSSIGNLSQETFDYGDSNENGYDSDSVTGNEEAGISFPSHEDEVASNQRTPWEWLSPVFKEGVAVLAANPSPEAMRLVHEKLVEWVAFAKATTSEGEVRKGKVLSCCTNTTKKRKTHGSKY